MTTNSLQRHILTIASSRGSSGEASAWARALAEQAGLAEDRAYALDLCIVEMVSNIVDHSYGGRAGGIRLELGLANEAASVTIIDEGPAFDPLSVPAPAVPPSLDEASVGGYGIHMVRSTADGCRYERRGARNVFTAWFGKVP